MNKYFEVIAISADKERLHKYGKDNGVKTFWVEMTREITPVKDILAVVKLVFYFLKEKPLIVHTHTPKAGVVGMLAAKIAGVPIRLHTVAGLPLLETTGTKRKILEWVEKFTYQLATRIYPNSIGLKEIILDHGFTRENKIKILGKGSSNGIDTSYFNPGEYSISEGLNLKTKMGVPQNNLIYIFIGRIVSEKGINELIDAFKQLQKIHPDVTLLLVGPLEEHLDPLREESMQEIKNNPNIISTGYQNDVRPYLAIADILVFPSYREGFPNVVMQAGAMGLPSIVSNINGCNEIIEEGKNGFIIPVKDKQALFQSMEKLLKDSVLRNNVSGRSREIICNNYDRKEFWKILKNEYDLLEKEQKKV